MTMITLQAEKQGAKGRHRQLTDVAPKQVAYNIKLISEVDHNL